VWRILYRQHLEYAKEYGQPRSPLRRVVDNFTIAQQKDEAGQQEGYGMKTYEFTLKFSLPVSENDMDELVERLGEAGCDDALIGIGQPGRIALEFARQAESAFDAISSAVANTKGAVPDAKLIEATPDLVGLTDVAEIVGCSRQNIRKIMMSSNGTFPPPAHEGKSALWHLSSVLVWLKDSKSYQVADDLLEVASINMQFNIAKEMVAIDPVQRTEILSLVG
jgi:hypothetical protein